MVVEERGEVELAGNPRLKALRVVYAIPFSGRPGFFDVQPTTVAVVGHDGILSGSELRIAVTVRDPTEAAFKAEIETKLRLYQTALGQLRDDFAPYNAGLRAAILVRINERRAALERNRGVLQRLGVPIRRREDAVIPIRVTPALRVRSAPSRGDSGLAPEPELLEASYDDILAGIRSMGIVMERVPATFAPLLEEGLRDFLLVVLNLSYHGDATGETFNGSGKTDILIRAGERNVFVAECKVWHDEGSVIEGLVQLLDNLGWRDTKAAFLLFVHNRNVSAVLTKAHRLFESSEHWRGTIDSDKELERRYRFVWPGDPERFLTVTLMVFAVPDTEGKRVRRDSDS